MPHPRKVVLALLPFALHGLAREVDVALGLLLRASIPPESFVAEVARVLAASGAGVVVRIALWIAAGALAWLGLAVLRRPWMVGELWRLAGATRHAARQLSLALGEVLTLTLNWMSPEDEATG